MTKTLADIDSLTLLREAHCLIACHKARYRRVPLWSFVAEMCCVGSTSAGEICTSLGWNPHQDASKPLPPRL